MIEDEIEIIAKLLELNGFVRRDKFYFLNDKCYITINFMNDYHIANENEGYYMIQHDNHVIYSDNLNIYWLVGYIIYNDLLFAPFKKL